ncbi:MAG: hypothetical protein Q4E41_07815 [Bacteroidales bacterium]|nr:hypothetical protein [Bacteroidales bacterium]
MKLLLLTVAFVAGIFTNAKADTQTLVRAYNVELGLYNDFFGIHDISDNLVGVVAFEKDGVNYLLVRDQGDNGICYQYSNLAQLPSDVQHYNIAGNKQQEYTQYNWILLHSKAMSLDAYVGKRLENIKVEGYMNNGSYYEPTECDEDDGYKHEKLHFPTHRVDYITPGSESATTSINTYCPTNFLNSNLVENTHGGVSSTYFFMQPKPFEFAHIVYAEYHGDDTFLAPEPKSGVNVLGLEGGFAVKWDLYNGTIPELVEGEAYEFDAVIFYTPVLSGGAFVTADGFGWGDCTCKCKRCTKYSDHCHNDETGCPSWDPNDPFGDDPFDPFNPRFSPKKKSAHVHGGAELQAEASAEGLNASYLVYPVNISKPIVTSVDEVSMAKELASVKYVNLQGQVSATPFDGVNIQVTTYTDGSTRTVKMMK